MCENLQQIMVSMSYDTSFVGGKSPCILEEEESGLFYGIVEVEKEFHFLCLFITRFIHVTEWEIVGLFGRK